MVARRGRAGPGGRRRAVPGVQVLHVALRALDAAGRAAHGPGAAARPLRRAHAGPAVRDRRDRRAVPALRRPPVLRHVPGAAADAGAARPAARARGAHARVRVVPRPRDRPHVVRARPAVRQPGEPAGRPVEGGPGQAQSHVHRGQAQDDAPRPARVRRPADGEVVAAHARRTR